MRAVPALLSLAFLAGCGGRPKEFPGVELAELGRQDPPSLRSGCSTEKCLYVYVAPWCGVCRASTGVIREFSAFLRKRGIDSAIVVGRDDEWAVESYAKDFGEGTLLDPEGRVALQGGVPQFIVTDRAGKVLKRQAGIFAILDPPIPEHFHIWLAAYFELIPRDSEEAIRATELVEKTLGEAG